MNSINKNIEEIRSSINHTCQRTMRDVNDVTLIAVTKTKPISDMQEAINCGILNVGENKAQEIQTKYPSFDNTIKWHMLGHLQTNKVKMIIDKVALIHSVDSVKLAEKINEEAKKHQKVQDILLQINISMEDSKSGFEVKDTESAILEIAKLPNVRIKGLMTIAPYVINPEENRPIFKKLAQIFVDINQKNIDNVYMDTLSMGMTNDYIIAIEEGATMVRIGTAIFGERNYNLN